MTASRDAGRLKKPQTAFVASIVLALVLPAVAPPATAALAYLEPSSECGVPPELSSAVPACPGLRDNPMGDFEDGAPSDECIDVRTSLVYSCAAAATQPRPPLGVGFPGAFITAEAHSALQDPDCNALDYQWCVVFSVATVHPSFGLWTCPEGYIVCGDSYPLRVEATIEDSCNPLDSRHYEYAKNYDDGVARWHNNLTGFSKCGPHTAGFITAKVTVSDAETGELLYEAEDSVLYSPQDWLWVTAIGCPPMVGDRVSCKLYEDHDP